MMQTNTRRFALTIALLGAGMAQAEIRDFDPTLADSQFAFRIRMADNRLNAYPADSLDFIMMDLEHPKDSTRHAHQCTSDMTGRTIEFFAEARRILPGLDRKPADRLFERILEAYHGHTAFARRFMPYWKLTKDERAMSAIKVGLRKMMDEFAKTGKVGTEEDSSSCLIEVMADLYEMNPDPELVEVAKKYGPVSLKRFGNHAHGHMSILRSMLKMGRVTGDKWFVETVTPYRDILLANEYADGSISEGLPRSYRTEGCALGDWIILNLRYWDATGDEKALDVAEHTVVNALWFNQFITGAFGHRDYRGHGYDSEIEEAWWCCTQTGGMALCEVARHAVQLVDGVVRVNYLVPGTYRLNAGGKAIVVELASDYPSGFSATAKVAGADRLVFRIPPYVKNAKTVRTGDVWCLSGDIGHYVEKRDGGWTLKYGPLMLAPMIYSWNDLGVVSDDIPKGYVPQKVDGSGLSLVEPKEKDVNGFWKVAAGPDRLPVWPAYDDGRISRTGTNFRAPAIVNTIDGSGVRRELFFHPMCYQMSNLTMRYVPMTFGLRKE